MSKHNSQRSVPSSLAEVTNNLSPHTIGELLPRPGRTVFQIMFSRSLQWSGIVELMTVPCPSGPRSRGQLRSALGAGMSTRIGTISAPLELDLEATSNKSNV